MRLGILIAKFLPEVLLFAARWIWRVRGTPVLIAFAALTLLASTVHAQTTTYNLQSSPYFVELINLLSYGDCSLTVTPANLTFDSGGRITFTYAQNCPSEKYQMSGTATVNIPTSVTVAVIPPAPETVTASSQVSGTMSATFTNPGNTNTSVGLNVGGCSSGPPTTSSNGSLTATIQPCNFSVDFVQETATNGVTIDAEPFNVVTGGMEVHIYVAYAPGLALTDSISFATSEGNLVIYPPSGTAFLGTPSGTAGFPPFYAVAQYTLNSKSTGQVVLQITDLKGNPISDGTGPPVTVLQGANRLVGSVDACSGLPGICLNIPAVPSGLTSATLVAVLQDTSGNPLAKTNPITYLIQQPNLKLTLGTRPLVTFNPLPATSAVLAAGYLGTSVPGATMQVVYSNLPESSSSCALTILTANGGKEVFIKGTSGTAYVDVSGLWMPYAPNAVFTPSLSCDVGVHYFDSADQLDLPLVLISPQVPTPATGSTLPLNTKTGFSFPINYQTGSSSGQLITTVAWGDGSPVFMETDPVSGSGSVTVTPPLHTFSSGTFAGSTTVTTQFKQASGSCPCAEFTVATYPAAGITVNIPTGQNTTAAAGSSIKTTKNNTARTETATSIKVAGANLLYNFGIIDGSDAMNFVVPHARPAPLSPDLRSALEFVPHATKAASTIPSFIGVRGVWSFSPSIPADGSFAANLTLYYSSADLPNDPNFSESAMQIFSYDPSSGAFATYPTTVDTINKTATAAINALAPYYSLAMLGPFNQALIDIPWFFETNGMDTKLAIVNSGGSDAHLSVNGYGVDGTLLAQSPSAITVSANTQLLNSVSALGFSTANIGTTGWAQTPADAATLVGVETIGNGTQFDALPLATGHAPYSLITDIESDSVYDTAIDVLNPTAGTLNFIITLHSPDGSTAGTYSGTLLPDATFSGTVDQIFTSITSPFHGFATVVGDGDVVASALISSDSSLVGVAGHPVGNPPSGAITLYGAQLGASGEYTRVILVNAGPTAANLVFTACQSNGTSAANPVSMKLASGAQMIADMTLLFGLASPTAGSFTITSDQPTVFGDLTFGDSSFAQLSRASVPLVSSGQSNAVIPYLENDSAAATTINIANPNSSAASVTLTTFNSTGTKAGSISVSVPANGFASPAAPGSLSGGYVTIASTQPVVAFGVVTPAAGTDFAAISAQPSASVSSGGGASNAPQITSVVNAADNIAKVSRGSLAYAFGSNLAAAPTAIAQSVPLPFSMNEASVTAGGVTAPVYAADPSFILFQIPYEVAEGASIPVVVTFNGVPSNTVTVTVADYALGFFEYNRTPTILDPQIFHLNGAVVTPASPAIPSETLIALANGIGKLNNPPKTDVAVSAPVPTAVDTPVVTVNGFAGVSQSAGLLAGTLGVVQMKIQLPSQLPSGTLPLVVQFPGDSSPPVGLYVSGNIAATGPSIGVAPTPLAFPSVTAGQNTSLSLMVSNTGTAALTVSEIASSNGVFSATNPATPFTVQAGATVPITVRFAPTSAGPASGTLTISSNDPNHPTVSVPVSGTGTAAVTLSVDGGTFNNEVGFPGAVNAVFVNRLTPPSYPATLTAVQIFFGNRSNGLAANSQITLVAATNPSGSASFSEQTAGVFNVYSAAVTAVGVFNVYTLPTPITITSGDFVVGFSVSNPAGLFPADEDQLTKSQGRSYVSSDGLSFSVVDNFGAGLGGNFGIRAVVTLGGS